MKVYKPEFIFQCRKCGHLIYCRKESVFKVLKKDCPECGEEKGELWILIGEGNYDKEYGENIAV